MAISVEEQDELRNKFLKQIKEKGDVDFFFELGEKKAYAEELRKDRYFYKEAVRINPLAISSVFFSEFVKENYEYAAEVYLDGVLDKLYDYDDELLIKDFPKDHKLFVKQLKALVHGNDKFVVQKTLSILDELVQPNVKLEIYKEAIEKYPEVINLIDSSKKDANADLLELLEAARGATKNLTLKMVERGVQGKDLQKGIEKYLTNVAGLARKKQKEISSKQTKNVNDALKR